MFTWAPRRGHRWAVTGRRDVFVTGLGTFISGALTHIDGRSYSCWSRLGAMASFTKLKPLSKPGCMLLVQELSLKKPFFYVKRK